jgi:hypothetical protein
MPRVGAMLVGDDIFLKMMAYFLANPSLKVQG